MATSPGPSPDGRQSTDVGQIHWWGRSGLNRRPTDYESEPLRPALSGLALPCAQEWGTLARSSCLVVARSEGRRSTALATGGCAHDPSAQAHPTAASQRRNRAALEAGNKGATLTTAGRGGNTIHNTFNNSFQQQQDPLAAAYEQARLFDLLGSA